MPIYRVVLECTGVNSEEGPTAARDIEQNFREARPHHQNVTCEYINGSFIVSAENDFDPKGLALTDEISDLISAFMRHADCEDIILRSSTTIRP